MHKSHIRSIEEFIVGARRDAEAWPANHPRWFRGEPITETPLTPTLYRRPEPKENVLLQTFRQRAPGFHDVVPDRGDIDTWLFLARHAGLPTRLLDWSEGALIGLYFALTVSHQPSVVWMLNPLQLNNLSITHPKAPKENAEFPLTWVDTSEGRNIGFANISGAWGKDANSVELPIAIPPTYVHVRLRGQKGCFTIQGLNKKPLNELVGSEILKRYEIDTNSRPEMRRELARLGITESVVFPTIDGLARELGEQYL
jgi:hypothetical protein